MSNSTSCAPASTATCSAASVFSGATAAAPRCPTTSGGHRRPGGSRLLDHDDRAVVAEIAARIRPTSGDDGVRDLLRGLPGSLGEQGVETLAPEEAGAAPGLDHAVGVEDDGRACGQLGPDRVVGLRRVDAERETAAAQRLDAAVGKNEPRLWMPRARAVDRSE